MTFNQAHILFTATSGRDESLRRPRGGDLLHPPPRRLHRRPPDQRPQLRREIPTSNTDG